ncbi:MAG: hypothetical protein O2779_05150 [Nanoarchaeota archaeon]|nr:hypothetical protein [Nanoarchaeota archaeon]
MNKKGITSSIMVIVIMMAVILVLTLRFYSTLFHIISGVGEDYFFCLVKKVISSYSKTPIVGLTLYGAFCPPVIQTLGFSGNDEGVLGISDPFARKQVLDIVKWYGADPAFKGKLSPSELNEQNELIDKHKLDSSSEITQYVTDNAKKGIPLGKNSKVPFLLEYRFEEVIAKSMKRCWGRNGEGGLPIGDDWIKGDFFSNIKVGEIFYCDLCEIVKFDNGVADLFQGGGKSMNSFLKNNPINRLSTKSYWEFIKDDSDSDLFKGYSYDIIAKNKDAGNNNDLAIVYVKRKNSIGAAVAQRVSEIVYRESAKPTYDGVELMSLAQFQGVCNNGRTT